MPARFDETRAPLEHGCPECGASAGKRCRKPVSLAWTATKRERGLRPPTRYQHVKPHGERVALAWRAWLRATGGALWHPEDPPHPGIDPERGFAPGTAEVAPGARQRDLSGEL